MHEFANILMLALWLYTCCKLTVALSMACPKHTEVLAAFIIFPCVLFVMYFVFEWTYSNIAVLFEKYVRR